MALEVSVDGINLVPVQPGGQVEIDTLDREPGGTVSVALEDGSGAKSYPIDSAFIDIAGDQCP